jgi:hypothetical protein
MNIFSILGVRYEVFHSRMLHWLCSPDGDHGAGDRYWGQLRKLLDIPETAAITIEEEVRVNVAETGRWRLADLLIRTGDLLILVENKVDPAYQDLLQLQDEIIGGQDMANAEGRRFLFVLIAPGPLNEDMLSIIGGRGGKFISWNDLLDRWTAVSTGGLDPHVSDIIRQYFEFARRPRTSVALADDKVLREAEAAMRTLVLETAQDTMLTAVELWTVFLNRFPDHAAALDAFYVDAKHYSAKSWFAFKLQQWAAKRDLIAETSQWQDSPGWGHPKVRVYRRISYTAH